MSDIFDQIAGTPPATPPKQGQPAAGAVAAAPASTTPSTTPASQQAAPSGDIFDQVASNPNAGMSSSTHEDAGLLPTLGSDLYNIGKSAIQLPSKALAYAVSGQPNDPNVDKQLQDAHDAHTHQVYQNFKQDFHAGNYGKALYGLKDLFDPHYDDPNDPISQMFVSQWDSSAKSKAAMMDAAKKGDTLGVIQHGAGVLPVASQVDAAMTNYQKEPTRENLAHVVSSAIPAFVPSLMRGAKIPFTQKTIPGASQAIDTAADTLRPTTEAVAGKEIPIRSAVANPGTAQSLAERVAPAKALQGFDIEQTQPAVRDAISKVATDFRNTTLDTLRKSRIGGIESAVKKDFLAQMDMGDDYDPQAVDARYQKLMALPDQDFQGVADTLRAEFRKGYKAAEQVSTKPGEDISEFQKAQDAEKEARANFDSEGVAKAIAGQKKFYDKANGEIAVEWTSLIDNTTQDGGDAPSASRAGGGAGARWRVVLEVASAWAVVKVLMPVRIVGCVWATPWFARVSRADLQP